MTEDWQARRLPDLFPAGLTVLFVGINPGRMSALAGHHFAGPQTTFWRLLFASGLTPRLLRPEEDILLPALGVGITNIVARPSRGEGDLAPQEFADGAERLRSRVRRLRPRVVALLGRRVAQAYAAGPATAGPGWGVVPTPSLPGLAMALPNPSSLSRVPYETRLAAFRAVAAAASDAT